MNKTLKMALGVVPLLLVVACTDPNKVPAESAIKAADQAAGTLTPEVVQLAPDQTKAFNDGLAAAKGFAAKQDFKAARAAAEGLPAKAAAAVDAARARMDAMKKAFDEAAFQLATKATALQERVAELAKAKKLPKGIAKDALEKAREVAAEVEAGAAKAKEEAARDAGAAAEAAKALAAKAEEAIASLTVNK